MNENMYLRLHARNKTNHIRIIKHLSDISSTSFKHRVPFFKKEQNEVKKKTFLVLQLFSNNSNIAQ